MKMITLANCIAEVESSGNPLAMRFEPSVYASQAYVDQPLIEKYATGGYISPQTASMIASTSFGLYQIMGYNLYDLGFTGTLCDFMSSASLQGVYLMMFFQKHLPGMSPRSLFTKFTTQQIFTVGAVYNGDGEAYSASLNAAFQKLSA